MGELGAVRAVVKRCRKKMKRSERCILIEAVGVSVYIVDSAWENVRVLFR